jgi:hypothetical protein
MLIDSILLWLGSALSVLTTIWVMRPVKPGSAFYI